MSRKTALAVTAFVGLVLAATAVGRVSPVATHTQLATSAAPASSARTVHHFRGVVTYRNRAHHWFGMRMTTGRSVRIHTSQHTNWHNCDWDDMGYGHHVAVSAYHSRNMWVATRVQDWEHRGHMGNMMP